MKQWKARPASEQLIGPKAEYQAYLESERKAAQKVQVAQQLKHSVGLQMFLEFVKERGEEPPKFLWPE